MTSAPLPNPLPAQPRGEGTRGRGLLNASRTTSRLLLRWRSGRRPQVAKWQSMVQSRRSACCYLIHQKRFGLIPNSSACIVRPMSSPETNASPLAAPVSSVWGVGEERAKLLARLEIFTVEDLLLHKPRRYEDRRKFLSIRDLKLKEAATVRGKIVAAGVKRFKKGTRAMFECVFDDGTGHLYCRWWQAQPWMPDWFAVGREFLVFGKPESLKPRTIDHPETELVEPGDDEFIHVNRIVPVHPLTEGLTARVMRTLVWRALENFEKAIVEPEIKPDL